MQTRGRCSPKKKKNVRKVDFLVVGRINEQYEPGKVKLNEKPFMIDSTDRVKLKVHLKNQINLR